MEHVIIKLAHLIILKQNMCLYDHLCNDFDLDPGTTVSLREQRDKFMDDALHYTLNTQSAIWLLTSDICVHKDRLAEEIQRNRELRSYINDVKKLWLIKKEHGGAVPECSTFMWQTAFENVEKFLPSEEMVPITEICDQLLKTYYYRNEPEVVSAIELLKQQELPDTPANSVAQSDVKRNPETEFCSHDGEADTQRSQEKDIPNDTHISVSDNSELLGTHVIENEVTEQMYRNVTPCPYGMEQPDMQYDLQSVIGPRTPDRRTHPTNKPESGLSRFLANVHAMYRPSMSSGTLHTQQTPEYHRIVESIACQPQTHVQEIVASEPRIHAFAQEPAACQRQIYAQIICARHCGLSLPQIANYNVHRHQNENENQLTHGYSVAAGHIYRHTTSQEVNSDPRGWDVIGREIPGGEITGAERRRRRLIDEMEETRTKLSQWMNDQCVSFQESVVSRRKPGPTTTNLTRQETRRVPRVETPSSHKRHKKPRGRNVRVESSCRQK